MFGRFHISTKLLLTILPLLFIALGTSAYFNNRYQEQEMIGQAQAAAQTYSDLIRESLVEMMTQHQRVDDDYLLRVNKLHDIQNLHIYFSLENLHLKDIYQEEDRMERLRKRQENLNTLSPEENMVFKTGQPLWQHNNAMFKAVLPFAATPKCKSCHEVPEGFVLGAAEMTIPLDRISASIQNNWVRSLWIVFCFTLAAIFLSYVVYHFIVAKRLLSLVEATNVIGSGNLDHPVTTDSSGDELGDLASKLEAMRVQLKTAQEKLIHTERLSTVGQMASSIIHDFRTPMSTINLVIESLQIDKDLTQEKIQEWYRIIRNAVQRMVTMAQELQDFSKGEIHLDKKEFTVGEFMSLLVESVKLNLEQSKIQLKIDEGYGGRVVFDVERMYRAIINIINNAQDAMPNGGILQLACVRENGAISFSIADTGSGIPPEIKDKIFDAFVTKGKKKGTGLGLAITKRIIDQHGGTIEVQSKRGKGTTFTIMIPVS